MDVIIIGGGLAGLAAATALAPRGFNVTILESRNRRVGRVDSYVDSASVQVVDNCQHVSMVSCTNFAHLCKTVGVAHFLQRQPARWFMTPDRPISQFAAGPVPA